MSRLWRSLKQACVYLHARETGAKARAGIGNRIAFSNNHRPHPSPGGTPPVVFYRRTIPETQPDRPLQKVAQLAPETVQTMASAHNFGCFNLAETLHKGAGV